MNGENEPGMTEWLRERASLLLALGVLFGSVFLLILVEQAMGH